MSSVKENLNQIKRRIADACARSNRSPQEITIVTVTKYVSIERMEEAYQCGLSHFGESRAQEAKEKLAHFKDQVTWHFIGHLQTNKVKEVLPHYAYIHSLDRTKLVNEIAKQAEKLEIRPKCFIQVNVSGEVSKQGVPLDEAMNLAAVIRDAGMIDVVGLMTMAPFTEEPETTRPIFRKLKKLQLELLDKNWPEINPIYLSMGMSNDFEVAIEEGATHVRIGTALVGK
jgi:pyridoxal phosphate enzyme (YggS family)